MAAAALLRNPRSRLPLNPRFPLVCRLSTPSAEAADTETPPPSAAAETPRPTAAKAITRLKTAIRHETDPDRLAALFESAALYRRFNSNPRFYPLVINKLALARRPDLIERLLEYSAASSSSPQSDGFLARIINLYSRAGLPALAVRAFDRAAATSSPVLGERSLHALLSAFLSSNQLDRAIEAFHQLPKQLNITPGLFCHNTLLQILVKKGDLAAARLFFAQIPSPDVVTYNTLLNAYSSNGDVIGVSDILKEISAKGLAPNAATYNCRIAVLCRKGEMFQAEELVDLMETKKVTPNRASFKLIIEGFCNLGDMESALRVFRRLKEGIKRMCNKEELVKWTGHKRDLLPDAEIYNLLIGGLVKKGDFGTGLKVCQGCLARKLVPEFELVKRLAEGLTETFKVDEAKDIVERMKVVVKDGDLEKWKRVESELYQSGGLLSEEK